MVEEKLKKLHETIPQVDMNDYQDEVLEKLSNKKVFTKKISLKIISLYASILLVLIISIVIIYYYASGIKNGSGSMLGPSVPFNQHVTFEEIYDINNVCINFELGLGENEYPRYLLLEENQNKVKYTVCLLNEIRTGVNEKFNEETIKLLEITDFSDNKYIFQKKYGRDGSYTLIYNKMEKIYIPKEVFTSSTGYFYIATIQFNLCNDGWIDSIEIYTRIKYELFEDNKVKLLVVDRFE